MQCPNYILGTKTWGEMCRGTAFPTPSAAYRPFTATSLPVDGVQMVQ